MKEMKVLVVTFEFLPFSGGISVYTDAIARGLADLECEVRVLAPRYPRCSDLDARSTLQVVRMNVRHGTAEWRRFLPGMVYLDRQLRDFRPDVALLTSDLAHGIGGLMCPRRGVPFVTVVHGSEIVKHFPPKTLKQYLQSRWLRSSYGKALAVFCVSRYVEELMLAAGFDREKLHVVNNGVGDNLVNAPTRPEKMAQLRSRLGLDGRKVILTLARLVPRKGQAEMIRAIPEIRRRHPDACYLIVGTGPEARHLRTLAAELGIGESVILTGEIPADDKIHYLDLCDIYALPSLEDGQQVEGLGIGLLEAGARARPLIGGRHGGVGEIIVDGVNGYLVDPRDTGELAERVVGLLDNPALAHSMGLTARDTVRSGFLATRMAHDSKRHLDALLPRGAKAAI